MRSVSVYQLCRVAVTARCPNDRCRHVVVSVTCLGSISSMFTEFQLGLRVGSIENNGKKWAKLRETFKK